MRCQKHLNGKLEKTITVIGQEGKIVEMIKIFTNLHKHLLMTKSISKHNAEEKFLTLP